MLAASENTVRSLEVGGLQALMMRGEKYYNLFTCGRPYACDKSQNALTQFDTIKLRAQV